MLSLIATAWQNKLSVSYENGSKKLGGVFVYKIASENAGNNHVFLKMFAHIFHYLTNLNLYNSYLESLITSSIKSLRSQYITMACACKIAKQRIGKK